MPISYVYFGEPLVGTAEDDFVIGYAGSTGTSNNTINAGDGDDWVLADSGNTYIPAQNTNNGTIATAFDLDALSQWTTDQNPQFGNTGIPHATALVEATIGQSEMFAVTIGAGQTITIDIDFGHGSWIGVQRDLVVEVRDAANAVLASGDDSAISDGGLGSFSTRDPYMTFTATTAGVYYINVRPFGSGPTGTFTDNATFALNVSVTGHAVTTNTVMGNDIVDGGAGNDTLFGQGGDDTINGGLGDDLIHGGSGSDTVNGGDGADVLYGGGGSGDAIHGDGGNDILWSAGSGHYFGDAGDDLVHAADGTPEELDGGSGTDTLDTASWTLGYTINLGTGATNYSGESFINFENLITGEGADTITGSAAANFIRTNAGNDVIDGAGGNDILAGGVGTDSLTGGLGTDTVDYTTAAGGVQAQLNTNAASNDGDGGSDTFSGIENLTGSNFNDTLIGDGVANVLRGGHGTDTLIGLGGNDTLWGGAGALNALQGGLGDDYYVLEAADSVIEAAGQGTDTVEARLSTYTLAANVENLIFNAPGSFTGTGNALANVITAGSGADVLRGRGGIDQLIGGSGIDTADYTLAAAGATARLDTQQASNDGDGASDLFSSIENLTGSNFNDLLIGNGGVNVLQGGNGSDTLLGMGGDDILYGGSGGVNNQLQGGTGNDYYVLDAFDSCVEFAGEGFDTVEARVGSYTLGNNVEALLYTGPGKFVGTGNALNNVITGAGLDDILRGGGGNDIINGGLGTDEVQLRGVLANYTIAAEGAGWRIVDSVAGRDGSTWVGSVEVLRFVNNATLTLAYPPPPPAPLEPADKDVGALILPSVEDDAFVLPAVPDDQPLILPGVVAFKFDDDPLVLPGAEENTPMFEGREAWLGHSGDWMLTLDPNGDGFLGEPAHRGDGWM